jgi:hypothetical protein
MSGGVAGDRSLGGAAELTVEPSVVNALGLLLLTIMANLTNGLLGCRLKDYLTNVVWAKHLVAFFLLLFFVILVENRQPEGAMVVLRDTVVIYAIFFLSTKASFEFLAAAMALMIIIMLTRVELRATDPATEKHATLTALNTRLTQITIGIIVVGVCVNFWEERQIHGYNLMKFLVPSARCSPQV